MPRVVSKVSEKASRKSAPAPEEYPEFTHRVRWQDVARDLLASSSPDAGVNSMLRRLGVAYGADRAWIFVYDATRTRFRNTHEWAGGDVTPFVDELQYTPVSMILWLHRRLLKNEAVQIDDIDGMPRQARALRAEFKRQGNKSVLCVPLMFRGELVGAIGFDAVRAVRVWDAEAIDALRIAGDLAWHATLGKSRPETSPTKSGPVSGKNKEAAGIMLRNGKDFIVVPPSRIERIEAARDYTLVKLDDGKSSMELRGLNEWTALLPEGMFVRVRRSTLVNLAKVSRINRSGSTWSVILSCGAGIPVGRAYRPLLRQHAGW